jgi:DNA helicase-2/ATP-dependent DNA helicase PcrA
MLRAYLERVTLVSDADAVDPSQGAVTLMTLHAAKGLEFGAVAMIGLEEGVLPHSRVQENPGELEEERRLCFVGITRAMRRLLMTCARYRTIRGVSERTIESRFLAELPKEHVTMSDQAGWHEPGWDEEGPGAETRARAQGSRGGPAWPGGGGSARDSRGNLIKVGARVRHPQFGVGEVVGLTPGGDARAQIKFRDVGLKTLVLAYARLERVD